MAESSSSVLALHSMAIDGRTSCYQTADEPLTDEQIEQRYGELLKDARTAFLEDPSYLVDIAEHSSLIAYKRKLWDVRMEVAAAEKTARAMCALDGGSCPFTCTNEGTCGFGRCRFATSEHAEVKTGTPTQDTKLVARPVPSRSPFYRLEDTIQALLAKRGIVAPARLTGDRRRRERASA